MAWTIQDLVLLRDAGVKIDPDAYLEALGYENLHRDFSSCRGCAAITGTQHQPSCIRASILFCADWYEILRQHEIRDLTRTTDEL
jgi:hypothetical protein